MRRPALGSAQRLVNIGIARNAARPGALAFDKAPRLRTYARPVVLPRQNAFDRVRQTASISSGKEKPRVVVPNELSMAADVRSHEHAALRHRLERLQGSHNVGESHATPGVRQYIDEV